MTMTMTISSASFLQLARACVIEECFFSASLKWFPTSKNTIYVKDLDMMKGMLSRDMLVNSDEGLQR